MPSRWLPHVGAELPWVPKCLCTHVLFYVSDCHGRIEFHYAVHGMVAISVVKFKAMRKHRDIPRLAKDITHKSITVSTIIILSLKNESLKLEIKTGLSLNRMI